MSKYLVTGATGFLGRHLVDLLVARGHDVVALARHAPRSGAREGVTVVRGDVLDREALQRAVAGCDGVFHCAGRVSRDPRDAEELWRVHVVGTRAVLDACCAAGVRRAVVASTSGTVGISEEARVATEDSPTPHALIQRFPYYRAKLYAEQEALGQRRDGLEVVCVNPSLLLGPGDVYGSSTGDVRLFLDRAVPAVPAGGLAYVDARDAADALLRAMERGTPGRRYLVNASNVTVREFFARLERVSGVKAPTIPMPRSPALARAGTSLLGRVVKAVGGELPVDPVSVEMAQLFWYVDASRAERELGWSARDPVETLVDTVRDLRGER
jgi:dihydroflavonol-4-reductase